MLIICDRFPVVSPCERMGSSLGQQGSLHPTHPLRVWMGHPAVYIPPIRFAYGWGTRRFTCLLTCSVMEGCRRSKTDRLPRRCRSQRGR
jgi:hypothetical protein